MRWIIDGVDDLNRVAKEFLESTGNNTIYALYGPMGVGKTTFVKAVAGCLGIEDDVNSPTFAIVNEYLTATETRFLFRFLSGEEHRRGHGLWLRGIFL